MVDDLNTIIARFLAPKWKICLGSVLSALIYPFLIVMIYRISSTSWEIVSGLSVEPPVIAFMSNYSRPAQNGYWIFVWSAIVSGFLLSALLPVFLGAGIGKLLLGLRYVNERGEKIGFAQSLTKLAYQILIFLTIAVPGPLLGFIWGLGSEILSLFFLAVGLIWSAFFVLRTDASGRSFVYRAARIVVVEKRKLDTFKQALRSNKIV